MVFFISLKRSIDWSCCRTLKNLQIMAKNEETLLWIGVKNQLLGSFSGTTYLLENSNWATQPITKLHLMAENGIGNNGLVIFNKIILTLTPILLQSSKNGRKTVQFQMFECILYSKTKINVCWNYFYTDVSGSLNSLTSN